MLPYESAVGADSISARQPAAIHNRGEASRPLPFLLLQQPAQTHPGFLCATSTSIFDTILQLLQIMPQKRQFVHFLPTKGLGVLL